MEGRDRLMDGGGGSMNGGEIDRWMEGRGLMDGGER